MAVTYRCLIVDDEPLARRVIARHIAALPWLELAAECGSGRAAEAYLHEHPVDVMFLDIKMPGIDGHEALARIKELDPQTRVIMLTGHGALDSAKEFLKHGAFDYLTKPCDIERLAGRINEAYYMTHKEKRAEKKAGDIMIPLGDYTTIGPENTVQEGIEKLKESFEGFITTSRLMHTGHRSLLVIDSKGELLGLLNMRGLMEGLRPSYLSAPKPSTAYSMEYSVMFWVGLFITQTKALAKKKVKDIMSPPPPSIDAEANLMEVNEMLFQHGRRRVVVTKDNKVVGVLREQELFFEMADVILESR